MYIFLNSIRQLVIAYVQCNEYTYCLYMNTKQEKFYDNFNNFSIIFVIFYLQEGYTALHIAAKYGHVEVLHALKSAMSWRYASKKVRYKILWIKFYIKHKFYSFVTMYFTYIILIFYVAYGNSLYQLYF